MNDTPIADHFFARLVQFYRECLEPEGKPLAFVGDYRTAPEREPDPARVVTPSPPIPPYDGSLARRRYWKRVTER